MTQMERAFQEIERLDVSYLKARWKKIRKILYESQNLPPDGRSDLTISREAWDGLRAIETSIFSLISAIESWEDE